MVKEEQESHLRSSVEAAGNRILGMVKMPELVEETVSLECYQQVQLLHH